MKLERHHLILAFLLVLIALMFPAIFLLWRVHPVEADPVNPFLQRTCTEQERNWIMPSVNGWCDGGWWVQGIVNNATHWMTPPTHFFTRALAQDDGVLEETVRQKGYDTTGVQGLISLLSPSTAGWKMNIRFPTRPEWGWLLVLDGDAVAQEHHWQHIILSDSALELSGWLHQASGNISYVDPVTGDRFMDVEVCISMQPETDCAGAPVDYKRWFKSFARLQ